MRFSVVVALAVVAAVVVGIRRVVCRVCPCSSSVFPGYASQLLRFLPGVFLLLFV